MLGTRFSWFALLAAFAVGAICATAHEAHTIVASGYHAAADWLNAMFLTIASLTGTHAGLGVPDKAILAFFRDGCDPTNTSADLSAPA